MCVRMGTADDSSGCWAVITDEATVVGVGFEDGKLLDSNLLKSRALNF
jgi:hypothetical protein